MVEEADLLARQLRAYGDALEAEHADRAAAPGAPTDPFVSMRDIRWILAAAAAVLFVLSGSIVWLLQDTDGDVIETDLTDDSVATTTPFDAAPRDVRVLPASVGWEMVQAESSDREALDVAGVWVWKVDEALVTLISPFGGDVAGSLAAAQPIAEHNRVMMGWQTPSSETVGLQAIGLDSDRLLELAGGLEQSDNGEWRLRDHDLFAARTAGSRPPTTSHQALFSALSSEPALRLQGEVDLAFSAGTEAELHAELFESSSLGPVEKIPILGHEGYVVRSDDLGPYALAHVDGVNVRVSPAQIGADADLDGFIASLERTDVDAWNASVERIELVIDRAGAEMLLEQQARAEAQAESQLDDLASDLAANRRVELPRYVLPSPWELDWVTDRGLWTEEQRLQSLAMDEANNASSANPGPIGTLVLSEGFAPAGVLQADLVLPEILLSVVDYGAGRAPAYESNGQQAFVLDGFEGSSMTNGPGGTPFSEVSFSDDRFFVSIRSVRVDEAELRAFAASLQLVGDDASRGFETTDPSFVLAARLVNQDVDGVDENSWISGYKEAEPGLAVPRVSVVQQTDAEFVMRLASPAGFFGTEIEQLSSGVYLLTPDDEELVARGVDGPPFATVIERKPNAGYTTYLFLQGNGDEAVALFEQLDEVDIDEWTELVSPINSDPLRPR